MFFMDPDQRGDKESNSGGQAESIASQAVRTVLWLMGMLSAGVREQGEGLHPAQFKLLMAMHHTPVSPSELAEHMQVSMPTISKTLGVLERRGLVERTVDENDRRRVLLVMTDEGRATMRRVHDAGIKRLSQILSSATPEELDRIERGMESLSDVFERAYPEHVRRHFGHSSEEGTATR